MKKQLTLVLLVVAASFLVATIWVSLDSNLPATESKSIATEDTHMVIQTYPHDTNAFTQGLLYADGFLYESTGRYGYSSLRCVELTTGKVIQQVDLPKEYFGEGITAVNGNIIQLTWKSQIGLIYDKQTLVQIGTFGYQTEGWGLTFDGEQLILSNGSDTLQFLDPVSFRPTGQIQVRDGDIPVTGINELEYIDGDIYANIWKHQRIAVINSETGHVKSWIDLSELQKSLDVGPEEVLNGIAYDAKEDRIFVTGKNWPNIFEIKLTP